MGDSRPQGSFTHNYFHNAGTSAIPCSSGAGPHMVALRYDTVTFTGFIWTLDHMVQKLNSRELKP